MKNAIIRMQFVFWLCAVSLMTVPVKAQRVNYLTIEECYTRAETNYPLVKQRSLMEKSKELSIENVSKGYFPQVALHGTATFQSDVTRISINLPGVNIPTINKDQYKIYGEITQPLTDILTINQQRQLQEVNSSIQQQNLEVDLYNLKDRMNQLFFGVLLLDEQLRQNELLKKDIQTGIRTISVSILNGVDYRSSLDKVKAELLAANQKSIELKASRTAYLDMLGLFINQSINDSIVLQKPISPTVSQNINRPELIVFESQKTDYDIQNKLITIKNLPKFELFFQGGFGDPSPVNTYAQGLTSYYIGGIRLSWPLSGFYTYSEEKQLNIVSQSMLDAQKETFLFNTNLTLKQQSVEIAKYQELMRTDDEIVNLRVSIKNTAIVQLENGVITANDYLREVNAEDQARQDRLLHEIQLLMVQYNYQNTLGN